MLKRIRKKIQTIFFAGLLVTVPTLLSFFLLKWLVNYIDNISEPLAHRFLQIHIPGIGFVTTILLVLAIGIFGTNFIGKKFVSLGERLLNKIPFVRTIYSSAKQIIETIMFATEKPFQQVVIVPYPRDGIYAMGLMTKKVPTTLTPADLADEVFHVFIPSTPNFTGGVLVMFPVQHIIPLDMTIEEGLTYLMTGGMLTPTKKEELNEFHDVEEWELFLH